MTSQLVEKAEAREKERQREEAKKQKKLDNAFKTMLKSATPPLEADAVWEEVCGRAKAAMLDLRYVTSY